MPFDQAVAKGMAGAGSRGRSLLVTGQAHQLDQSKACRPVPLGVVTSSTFPHNRVSITGIVPRDNNNRTVLKRKWIQAFVNQVFGGNVAIREKREGAFVNGGGMVCRACSCYLVVFPVRELIRRNRLV